MKLLKWKDSYSMGEDEIDKQHKGLFKLSKKLNKRVGFRNR